MNAILDHILTATSAKPTGLDKWFGHCRAHGSQNHRDLSIRITPDRILVFCFAACSLDAICLSLGIEQRDLFFDKPLPRGQWPTPRPVRVDRVKLAFRFELHALDLRLRAERIIEAGKNLDVASLSDHELDWALGHAAKAHDDVERAELFEHVADNLRLKEFLEKDHARHKRVA